MDLFKIGHSNFIIAKKNSVALIRYWGKKKKNYIFVNTRKKRVDCFESTLCVRIWNRRRVSICQKVKNAFCASRKKKKTRVNPASRTKSSCRVLETEYCAYELRVCRNGVVFVKWWGGGQPDKNNLRISNYFNSSFYM